MLNNVQYLFSETQPNRLAPSASEVCFVGRSNVGKSTLINALCGQTVARVSRTPGRTQMINVFSVGKNRWLVDLPGYGYAKVPKSERDKWGPMIEGYLTQRPCLRRIFTLVDAQVGPTALDLQLHRWLESLNLPWKVVATKTDQVKPSRAVQQRLAVARAFGLLPQEVAWVSAREGRGIQELQSEVARFLTG